jgi:ADP-heptose:LPS heptosyltransferase
MRFEPTDFYHRTRAARKVAVVDLGFLGDTVHLVPALWELRRAYPEARLHVLTTPVGCEVLALAPCVERAWAFPLGSPSPPWWRHWGLMRSFRREGFEVAFNFSGADRSIFLTALSGARWRVAHAAGRTHFWNSWLIRDWVPRRDALLPVYEQRRQVLAACGLKLAPSRWDLQIPAAAARQAESLVPPDAIHFSINASTPLKEWPLENWVDLARRLLREQPPLRIVASGSANAREQARLRGLVAGVGEARLRALPPGLPIAGLAAALQRCRLHIGGDSGVLHLAVAVGVPTLALFRQYADASAWMPSGPAHRALLAPCECVHSQNQPCAANARAECLAHIPPGKVAEAAKAQLTLETSHSGS